MAYTNEQIKAINIDTTNLLINAGAGSGKTTVLTERIINKLKKGIKISSLLVLTFTNAAAKEMKERIISKVEGEESLKEQLPLVHMSDITTFDGYMLNFVKEYGYVLDINNNISIGDKALLTSYLEKAIDNVFSKYYSELEALDKTDLDKLYNSVNSKDNSSYIKDDLSLFVDLISQYTVFDDANLQGNFKNLYYKYINILDKDELLESASEDFINAQFALYEQMLFNYISSIRQYLTELNKYRVDKKSEDYIDEYQTKFEELLLINNINDLVDFIPDFKLPSASRHKGEEFLKIKGIQLKIKKEYENLAGNIILDYKDDLVNEELGKTNLKEFINKLLLEIDEEYFSYKKQDNIYEFLDITNMALNILRSSESVRNNLKNKYEEILIDEYQDTNDFQNEFVKLIQNDNLYLVGDVKQSIYGFRNANPKNFKNMENAIQDGNMEGEVVNLLHNFRSRNEVLESVNKVFERLMNPNIGMIDYKDNHALVYGNKKYDTSANMDYFMNLIHINKDDFVDIDKKYIEPFVIGYDILNKINTGSKVLKDGELINSTFSDFTILTRFKTSYPYFKEVFDFLKIPVHTQLEENLNSDENYELLVILNVLHLVINPSDKHALISVLRSFLYELDEQKIYDYFKNDIICEEITEVFNKIDKIREIRDTNLSLVLKSLYVEFNFFDKVVLIDEISTLNERLLKVDSVCEDLSSSGKSLSDLIEYLEYMFLNTDDKFEMESDKNLGNSVKVMTIHKSKGLEFPYVYIAKMDSDIYKASKDLLNIENKTLIIPKVTNYVRRDSFLKSVQKNINFGYEVDESIRLLYVAMTRAHEKVTFVDYDTSDYLEIADFLSFNKFSNLISELKNKDVINIEEVDGVADNIDLEDFSDFLRTSYKLDTSDEVIDNSFEYFKLEPQFLYEQKVRSSMQVAGVFDSEEKERVDLGIILHDYLEKFDFFRLNDPQYVEQFILSIDDKYKKFIQKIVNNFLNYDMLKNIKNFYTEYEFFYSGDIGQINGIIDLLVESEDCVYIIDYKLSGIDKKEYDRQLSIYYKAMKEYYNKDIKCYLYSLLKDEYREVIC